MHAVYNVHCMVYMAWAGRKVNAACNFNAFICNMSHDNTSEFIRDSKWSFNPKTESE